MSANIIIRLYEELNDFVPSGRKKTPFSYPVGEQATVAVVLDRLGVPPERVELVFVNGVSVDFTRKLHDGDQLSVFPMFESLDIGEHLRVRDRPLRDPHFVLDAHLGKLAAHLRMLGFDTLYKNDFTDRLLMALSRNKGRILLSKDRTLVYKSGLTRAYEVKAVKPRQQLSEVLDRFDLYGRTRPFTRCMICNAVLETVRKEDVAGRVPPGVWQTHDTYRRCPACHKVYWPGSHYQRMQRFIADLIARRHSPNDTAHDHPDWSQEKDSDD